MCCKSVGSGLGTLNRQILYIKLPNRFGSKKNFYPKKFLICSPKRFNCCCCRDEPHFGRPTCPCALKWRLCSMCGWLEFSQRLQCPGSFFPLNPPTQNTLLPLSCKAVMAKGNTDTLWLLTGEKLDNLQNSRVSYFVVLWFKEKQLCEICIM